MVLGVGVVASEGLEKKLDVVLRRKDLSALDRMLLERLICNSCGFGLWTAYVM